MDKKRFGVIDIGTLKVKLQIVELDTLGELRTLYSSNKLTCLGCHMDENNSRPKPENLKRTIDELRRCKKILEQKRVSGIRVVSTHALREMGPVGKEVAGLIKEKVSFAVELISQQEEAELFYKAVLRDFDTDEDFTIADVGGGSVQILIGNRKELKRSFLLKTGTSTLWDKFTPEHKGNDHPTRTQISKMKDYILNELQPIPANINTPLVYGSSCIIDVFKAIGLSMERHDQSVSHPYKVSIQEIDEFLDKVWGIPYGVRERKFVSPTRRYMWGIDKAFLNVVELAKRVGSPYVIPSNANINQGLVLKLLD